MKCLFRLAIFALLTLAFASCRNADVEETFYRTYADAEADGAVKRGWIPFFVPRSATDIHETHDLDSNLQFMKFTFRKGEFSLDGLVKIGLADIPAQERFASDASWWPRSLNGRDFFVHWNGEQKGYLAVDWKSAEGIYWTTLRSLKEQ